MKIFSVNANGYSSILYVLRPDNYERIRNKVFPSTVTGAGTENARLMARIDNLLFNGGINLNKEYEYFYSQEYETFKSFLENEKGVGEHLLNDIATAKKDNEELWYINISDFDGYTLSTLFDKYTWSDNDLIERINSFFDEVSDENM